MYVVGLVNRLKTNLLAIVMICYDHFQPDILVIRSVLKRCSPRSQKTAGEPLTGPPPPNRGELNRLPKVGDFFTDPTRVSMEVMVTS